MDPEAMRRCMSFGFSDKKSKSAIGQCINLVFSLEFLLVPSFYIYQKSYGLPDGNGFKTSSMRLGGDVIVFSRYLDNRFGSYTTSIFYLMH